MLTLDDVKNYLNITYEDEDVNSKLSGIMTRADYKIRDLVAAAADAELTPSEEQLVLDLCRYIFNDAAEDFEKNFQGDINGARGKRQVAAMIAEEAENGG